MSSTQRELGDALTARETTRAMKEIFRETFHNLGGAEWLTQFVQESPANARVFVQILGKLIPPQVEKGGPQSAQIIDLPWVQRGRLSYKTEMQQGVEEYQEQ